MVNRQRPAEKQPWPKPAYAWYVVGVLTFGYLVAVADRNILTLMIEPIRHDLGISDTQVSLLIGFAFVIFYAFAGIPIGWLADHRSRRLIIGLGASLWTLMTAASGLAQSFTQLFLARIGVGVGEATLTPSAYSMIADYFPPRNLGRAIGVYMSGAAVGAGLTMIVGGAVIAYVAGLPPVELPVVGVMRPWQLAFICVSIPGLLLAALMATVREPLRRGRLQLSEDGQEEKNDVSFRAGVTYVTAHWRTYVPLFVGFAMVGLMKGGLFTWVPTMYIRSYDWSISSIGFTFGIFQLVFGPLGAVSSGWIADKLRQQGYVDAPIRVVVVALFVTTPIAMLMPLMPTATGSLVMLAILPLLLFVCGALVPTAFQLATPNRLRAQITALSTLTVTLLGDGLGPLVVALITDYGFRDVMALRYSMSIVAAVATPLAALIFWWGLKHYRAQIIENEVKADAE